MNLIRLIIIALIIYLVIRIFKRWSAAKKIQPRSIEETNMVRCKVCDLHIPEKEALQHDGEYYCSQKHLEENKSN